MTNYDDYFGGLTREEYEEETKEHFEQLRNMQKMNKWEIKVILKSGKELSIYYSGKEDNSDDIAKLILNGDVGTFRGFKNMNGHENTLINVGEIAAISIINVIN